MIQSKLKIMTYPVKYRSLTRYFYIQFFSDLEIIFYSFNILYAFTLYLKMFNLYSFASMDKFVYILKEVKYNTIKTKIRDIPFNLNIVSYKQLHNRTQYIAFQLNSRRRENYPEKIFNTKSQINKNDIILKAKLRKPD